MPLSSRLLKEPPRIVDSELQMLAVPVEPVEGYWTGNAKFGQRFQGRMPATPGVLIPCLENAKLPGPPQPWTIHLFRSDRNAINEGDPINNSELRARITYGAGGASSQFECDVISGAQFSLVCNSVRVDFVSYRPNTRPAVPYLGGQALIVGAMLGKGACATKQPVTLTTEFTEDSSWTVPIPDFARSVAVVTPEDDPATLAGIRLLLQGPAITNGFDIGLYPDIVRTGVPIAGGLTHATIDNNLVAGNGMALQFFLSL